VGERSRACGRTRADGSVELDGLLHRDDIKELTGLDLQTAPSTHWPVSSSANLAGFPEVGDNVEAVCHCFTVTEMDGRRVARIRITPIDDQVDADDGHNGVNPTQATP
jgi:putative hemolysin